jgi:hypothetical protein
MAAAEFERELIRERSMAGLKRYRGQYAAGMVGKEVHSRSGKDLPVGLSGGSFALDEHDLRAVSFLSLGRSSSGITHYRSVLL